MYRTVPLVLFGSFGLALSSLTYAQDWFDVQSSIFPVFNDQTGIATDPGRVPLSLDRLFRLEPKLAPPAAAAQNTDQRAMIAAANAEGRRMQAIEMFKTHMESGDSRAAVVFSVKPLIVAAYSDDLDAVAMLRFPDSLVTEHNLKPGSRLLTVNSYPQGKADDLRLGPKQTKKYENFFPIIADFVTDDQERVRQRKTAISESEWQRCSELAKEHHQQCPQKTRDGSPLRSMLPGTVASPGFFLF
jgi:hypothetical protein